MPKYKKKRFKNKRVKNKRRNIKKIILSGVIFSMFAISALSTGISQDFEINESEQNYIRVSGEKKSEQIVRSVVDDVPSTGKQKIVKRKGIIDVPYINQAEYYPTGCEVVSATMILNYYGYDIDVEKYINKYLDMSTIETKDGILIAEDPNNYFVGDPRSPYSYGCFAPVIVKSMNKILENGQEAKNITGMSLKDITQKYIEKGIPVLIWATIEMKEASQGTDWLLKGNNRRYHWVGGEHCLVLVGYDKTSYYFNDPYNNNGLIAYSKKVVEARYKELDKQAIVIEN